MFTIDFVVMVIRRKLPDLMVIYIRLPVFQKVWKILHKRQFNTESRCRIFSDKAQNYVAKSSVN